MSKHFPKLAGIAGLILLKQYYNGSTCDIRRDLSGQVAIITGGNSGIGRETALGLAKQNCTVLITGRDNAKCEEAVKYIRENSGNSDVEYRQLDLANKESVNKFAASIHDKFSKVNILVNNAGLAFVPKLTLNPDGIEVQIATNHFGHFYLTSKLWDLLRTSENLRIINVSSQAHLRNFVDRKRKVEIDFDNLDGKKDYDPVQQYCVSKLANVVFTKELAQRVEKINPNARVVALHPGKVRTDVIREGTAGLRKIAYYIFYPIWFFISKNSTQGAQTTLYTVSESKQLLRNGGYYDQCKQANVNPFAQVPQNQKLLWDRTQEILGVKFPAK